MPDISAHSADEFLQNFREQPLSAPVALYAGAALHAAGRTEEAVAVWTLGADADPALRSIHRHPEANAETRAHSVAADRAISEHFTALHAEAVDAVAEATGANLSRVRRGVWPHYAVAPFSYRVGNQQPLNFYMPDLPALPIAQRESLPWADAIEAAYPDIRAEYEAALAAAPAFAPYVFEEMHGREWDALRGNPDWAALYLHYNAAPTDNVGAFPKTLAALSAAPLVGRKGVPLETFFSRLKPKTSIPPHFGLTNTRMTVHLPIIVPDGVGDGRPWLGVGDERHFWREGEIVAFDDSFVHQAANPTDQDRTVLIFETHHPDLTEHEITAIQSVYEAFDAWVQNRRALLGMTSPAA